MPYSQKLLDFSVTNGVLINCSLDFGGIKTVFGFLGDGDKSGFDFKISCKFPDFVSCHLSTDWILESYLSICAHENIGFGGILACFVSALLARIETLGLHFLLPSSLHSKTAKEYSFGTSCGSSSNGLDALGDTPEVANHADAALMNMKHRRIFIIVTKILGYILHNQLVLA